MAEEVIRGGAGGREDQGTGFEGMEALAQAIELGTSLPYLSVHYLEHFTAYSAGSGSDFPQRHHLSNQPRASRSHCGHPPFPPAQGWEVSWYSLCVGLLVRH